MKLKKYIIGAVSTSLIALMGTSAQATTVQSTDLGDLVHDAEACVIGTVSDVSYETKDGQTFTYATFDVTEVAFGNVSNTVTVKMPGGRISTATIPVNESSAGTPRFFSNMSYFLLLDNAGDEFVISGVFQGAVPIVNDRLRLPQSSVVMDVDAALAAVNDMRTTPALGR